MLAGGAPLHAERLAARGGPADAVHDELTFFDVSSYGPRTVDAMLRVVGADRLVHGSDRPVAGRPPSTPSAPSVRRALAEANPARLLSRDRGDRLMLPHLPSTTSTRAGSTRSSSASPAARSSGAHLVAHAPTRAPTSSSTATSTSPSG